MTVKDLIEALGQMPQEALVYAYDANTESDEEVCGVLLEQWRALAPGLVPTHAVTICTSDD